MCICDTGDNRADRLTFGYKSDTIKYAVGRRYFLPLLTE